MSDPEKCPRCGVTELCYNMRKVSFFCAECDWQERLYTESEIAAAELRAARAVRDWYRQEGTVLESYIVASLDKLDDDALRSVIDRDREKEKGAGACSASGNLDARTASSAPAPASLLPALMAVRDGLIDDLASMGFQVDSFRERWADHAALLALAGSARESDPPSKRTSGDQPTPTPPLHHAFLSPRVSIYCQICGGPEGIHQVTYGTWKEITVELDEVKRMALQDAARDFEEWAKEIRKAAHETIPNPDDRFNAYYKATVVEMCAERLEAKAKEGG